MPNHIKNRLIVSGEQAQVDAFFDYIKGKNGDIDFESIIPMPQTYKDYDTTNHPMGRGIEDERQKSAYIKATHEQRDKYGAVGWYDWSCRNWGTKWNAYDIMRDGNIIEWNTAWCGVSELMEVAISNFPQLSFEYMYADEDAGNNTGVGEGKDGALSMRFPDYNSEEAWNIYFELNPWAQDEMEFIDGQWTWK